MLVGCHMGVYSIRSYRTTLGNPYRVGCMREWKCFCVCWDKREKEEGEEVERRLRWEMDVVDESNLR